MASISGRKVLVTGGTTGIGRAIGMELARHGADVFIFSREQTHLDDAINAFKKAGLSVQGTTADQANREDVARVFTEAQAKLGGLDVVVANAGISADGLGETSDEDWRYALDVNLGGYLDVAKHALEAFKGRQGDIVLIGSVSGDSREPGTSVYAATKAGVAGFARTFREEAAKKNIRVSLIEPGAVGSDMQEKTPEEQRKAIDQHKMLKAEDVAELVAFMLGRPQRCILTEVRIEPRLTE